MQLLKVKHPSIVYVTLQRDFSEVDHLIVILSRSAEALG